MPLFSNKNAATTAEEIIPTEVIAHQIFTALKASKRSDTVNGFGSARVYQIFPAPKRGFRE